LLSNTQFSGTDMGLFQPLCSIQLNCQLIKVNYALVFMLMLLSETKVCGCSSVT